MTLYKALGGGWPPNEIIPPIRHPDPAVIAAVKRAVQDPPHLPPPPPPVQIQRNHSHPRAPHLRLVVSQDRPAPVNVDSNETLRRMAQLFGANTEV